MGRLLSIFTVLVLTGYFVPVNAAQHSMTAKDVADIVFSKAERLVIERYFEKNTPEDDSEYRGGKKAKKKKAKGKGKKKGLPPGLAKRKSLPPGLAKRAALPPGLAKRTLPRDLVGQLPPAQDGTDRTIVDDNVVLIEAATGKVLDILEHVLTK